MEFKDMHCPYCGHTVSYPLACAGTVQECPLCCEPLVMPDKAETAPWTPPLPFKTVRMVLRRVTFRDVEELADWWNRGTACSAEEFERLGATSVQDWIREAPDARLTQPGGCLHVAAELLAPPTIVGLLTLRCVDRGHRRFRCALVIHREYRGRGFGTEALRGMAEIALRGFRAHRLVALCDRQDVAAVRTAEKAGFHEARWSIESRSRAAEGAAPVEYVLQRSEK